MRAPAPRPLRSTTVAGAKPGRGAGGGTVRLPGGADRVCVLREPVLHLVRDNFRQVRLVKAKVYPQGSELLYPTPRRPQRNSPVPMEVRAMRTPVVLDNRVEGDRVEDRVVVVLI